MNAKIRLALCAPLVASLALCGADPGKNRVLLIDYNRILEGDIERVGNQFRVREPSGGEMTFPATPAMMLVTDRAAAFELVKARAKLGEPLERVRLARWCLANQLKTQAIAEAEAALALQPGDRSLARFVADVKLQTTLAPPPSVASAKPQPKLLAPEPAAQASPEAYSLFVSKVQPLLMNACARCHGSDYAGAFKLRRTDATFPDKRATQLNLVTASAVLNREQLSASALLARAISAHGGASLPPLRDRQAPAFKHLEEWARLTTGKALAPAAPPAALPEEAIAGAQPLAPEAPARSKGTPPVVTLPTVKLDGAVTTAIKTEPAPEKTEPSDPFDPVLFNKPPRK